VTDTAWVRPAILTVLRDEGPQHAKQIRFALPTHDAGGREVPFSATVLYRHLAWLHRHGLADRVEPGPRPLWRYVTGAPDDES